MIGPALSAEQLYRRKLSIAVKAMNKSVEYWLGAAYRRALETNQDADRVPDPQIAQDAQDAASPALERRRLFAQLFDLRKRWEKHFGEMAKSLALEVVDLAYKANKTAWQAQTKRAGFDVPMQLTESQRTILDVKVRENVDLIRSIPSSYFEKISGDVTRGFLNGRDLEHVAGKLRDTGETTERRAALIARDQANKLTAQMNSARQRELGITYAYWKHSTVDKDPRPGHLRASKEKWIFDTQVGIDFGDQFGVSKPGEPINCRCGSRSIIPGLDADIGPDDLEPVPGFPGAFKLKAK